MNFNSFMVRLKGVPRQYLKEDQLFQFLHGAIKRGVIQTNGGDFNKFQFLHGAIKRRQEYAEKYALEIFQFLHGAIKRKTFDCFLSEKSYFNSFMVRLKVAFRSSVTGKYVFQFLHGAIKRSCFF